MRKIPQDGAHGKTRARANRIPPAASRSARQIPSRATIANVSSIGEGGQAILSNSCIGIAGLGGVGGIAFEQLVRAGVGRLKISDSGFFEESNANRQSLWSKESDGMEKTAAAIAFAKSVGSPCRISPQGEITAKNSPGFARGCSAVIDATDTHSSRIAVFSGCKKERVPCVFASARGHRGMLSVFIGKGLGESFLPAVARPPSLPCDHALGPVANSIGCLAAQQAMNICLGKQSVRFPSVLSIDAFSGTLAVVHKF